jgi:hypothetical protein
MRSWFPCSSNFGSWLYLCLTPMQLCTAFKYNLCTRGCQVLLRCILPLLLVLAIVAACMYAGIWELQRQHEKSVAAATAAAAAAQPPSPSPKSAACKGNSHKHNAVGAGAAGEQTA